MNKLEEIYQKNCDDMRDPTFPFLVLGSPECIHKSMKDYADYCLSEFISDLKNQAHFQMDLINVVELKNAILQK